MIVPLISCLKNDSIYCRKYPKWNFDISIYSIHSTTYSEYDVQFTSASFWRLDELLERRKDSRERCHAAMFPTHPDPLWKMFFFGQRWFSLVEEITVEQNPRNWWLQPRFSQISCLNVSCFFSQHPFSKVPKCHISGWISPCCFFPRDLAKLYEVLETARNPSRLLMAKLEEMEDGQFVPGRKHGNWEPLINTNPQRVLNLNIEDAYILKGIVGDHIRWSIPNFIGSIPFCNATRRGDGSEWGKMLVFFQPRKTLEVNLGAIFRDRWRNSGGRSPSKYAGDWRL